MSIDFELKDWRAEWQAQSEPSVANSVEIRRRAVKQQRRLRALHIAELLAALIFLAFSSAVAWKIPRVESFLWALAVWITTLAVTAFSLWNWHILWKADLKSVSEFAQEYEKRCLASLRAARFGKGFVVVQVAISVPWLTWDYLRHHLSNAAFGGSMALLIVLTVGFWVKFSRFRQVARRELHEVQEAGNVLANPGQAERSIQT